MRFWRTFQLLALALAGCAHIEPPPGGPEDRVPPTIAATAPPTEAVVAPFDAPVVIQFDERISQDRVEEAVAVSPRTSPVAVRHGRSSLRVSLRDGWREGQIYHVTINRSLRDLFGNSLEAAQTIVFSTGPEIPDNLLEGVVTDRITGRPVVDARVEAIRSADSLVYAVQTDSVGGFVLNSFPAGSYRVRAFEDANRNRSLELFEPSDTTDVVMEPSTPVAVRLRLLAADSTPAAIASVQQDSLRVRVTFDDYLDPSQVVTPEQVELVHPTTGTVAVDSVRIAAEEAPQGSEGPLPSQRLEVFLADGVLLDPSVEYALRITGIRNVNGLTGDVESTFEPPEPPAAPDAADVPDAPDVPDLPDDPAVPGPAAANRTPVLRAFAFGGV